MLREAYSHLPYADLVVPVVQRMMLTGLGPPVKSVITRADLLEALGPNDPNAHILIPILELMFLEPEPPSPPKRRHRRAARRGGAR